MKTLTASSATSSQREQTSLLSQMPRSPRSNVCSTPDLENPSASVHPKRFSTPSLTLKFLCAGKLNPRFEVCPRLQRYAHSLDQSSILLFFAAMIAKQYSTLIANQSRTLQHLDKRLVVS